jgi:hypothetical protein
MATAFIEAVKRANLQFQLADAVTLLQTGAKLNEYQKMLTYNAENPAVFDYVTVFALSTAQTGSAVSTFTLDTGLPALPAGALFRFVTTIGATPTCTYAIQGSADNTNWSSVPYATSAAPDTFVTTTFVTTTAVTKLMFVKPFTPMRYYRINYTANTNVTNTCDTVVF